MPNYQPLHTERHHALFWHPPQGMAYAAHHSTAPLALAELYRVLPELPIAFLCEKVGEQTHHVPVALLSLAPGLNLYVGLDGKWQGDYVPAFFRGEPFRLLPNSKGDLVLCVDEASGLISESGTAENALFTSEGQITPPVRAMMDFLLTTQRSCIDARRAADKLAAHGLIKAWEITVKNEGKEQTLQGLFQVDEARLNQLTGDALHDLLTSGALLLAYSQLLSRSRLQALGKRSAERQEQLVRQAQAAAAQAAPALDDSFFAGDTISFSGLN